MSSEPLSAPVWARPTPWGSVEIMWGPEVLGVVERAPRARNKFRAEVFGTGSTHDTKEQAIAAGMRRARSKIASWKMPDPATAETQEREGGPKTIA